MKFFLFVLFVSFVVKINTHVPQELYLPQEAGRKIFRPCERIFAILFAPKPLPTSIAGQQLY